jgi:hypothetical protein
MVLAKSQHGRVIQMNRKSPKCRPLLFIEVQRSRNQLHNKGGEMDERGKTSHERQNMTRRHLLRKTECEREKNSRLISVA